jgi:hypothetical protein
LEDSPSSFAGYKLLMRFSPRSGLKIMTSSLFSSAGTRETQGLSSGRLETLAAPAEPASAFRKQENRFSSTRILVPDRKGFVAMALIIQDPRLPPTL